MSACDPALPAQLGGLVAFSLLSVVLSIDQTSTQLPTWGTADQFVPLTIGNKSDEENVSQCPDNQCLARKETARRPGLWDLFSFGCFCDEECAAFGDCCRDVGVSSAAPEGLTCSYADGPHYYMVARCPDSWPHDATRRACETDDIGPSKDPLAALPVTSPRTGRTYRSAACARCHGDTKGAVLWSTLLRCPVTGPGEAENTTAASLRQNEAGVWGVMVTANGSESFRPCQLELQLPRSLGDEHVRGCLPAVSECAPDWGGPETAVQCGAYTGRVLDLSRANRRAESFGHVYRNLHCALCNGVPADVLVCGRLSRFRGGGVAYASPSYPSSLPFSILLDISDRSGSGTVGAVTVCDDGRLWDPFFHKCRYIFCDDGYTLKDDTCVPEVESPDDGGAESSQFKLCPKFYLTADEFENRSDGSVYVQLYDQRYAEEEFELRDGELVVCSKSGDFSKFDAALGTLSLVFVVVSIVCLCCHLALFCLVPEQRNLPGKNLAALCACLLAGYICFVAAPFQEPASEGCRALGVVMYAAFMASFFWMNVMAFDVFISLRHAMTELRVASGKRMKTFLLYSLYAFGFTAGLVVAAIATDTSQHTAPAYRPGFGERVCWFSRRRALLVFFAVPLLVIMVANMALFVGSALLVRRAAQSAAAITCSPSQTNLKLYCRLAVISGLSWAIGLAAGWVDFPPLWHVFVVLNTLQGVFIFVSFTMARRVRGQARRQMSRLARWRAAGGGSIGAAASAEGDGPPAPDTTETRI